MTDFDPIPWQPLPAPSIESNHRLATASLWDVGASGPEDVIVTDDGAAIVGTDDGSILRVTESTVEHIADVGGRPLGLEWYGDDIIVCNAFAGLQLVSLSGTVTTRAAEFEGSPLMLTNNAAVASDGTIYFSDSSTRWDLHEYVTDLLEGQSTGRVFRLTGDRLEVVVDGLQFANGVTLDADEGSLFIAETGKYRIHRHWLVGDAAGSTELFIDNLPGYPDNLTFDGETLWVACASPRQAVPDFIAPRPWMRSVAHRLPQAIKPKAVRHGMVFGYDTDGHVVHDLQDPSGTIAITTSARHVDGRLFVGQLEDPAIAVLAL